MISILIIVSWTIASIWYTILNLGNKNKTSLWWEWVIAVPMLIIAYTFAGITKLMKKYKKPDD